MAEAVFESWYKFWTRISRSCFVIRDGKVKYLGISECTPQDLRRAHVVHPISAYQMEVSPFSRHVLDPKLEFLKTAREIGATIVVYSPLGRGMLTGQLVLSISFNQLIIKFMNRQQKSFDDLAADDFRRTIPRCGRTLSMCITIYSSLPPSDTRGTISQTYWT
jgi:hypothetical protein